MTVSTEGSCVKDALRQAGVMIPPYISIPDRIPLEEMPVLCAKLNLEWYGGGEQVTLGVEPVIVLYETTADKGHAEYLDDIGSFLETEQGIIGLIRAKKEYRQSSQIDQSKA